MKIFAIFALGVSVACFSTAAVAQSYPAKTVTVISPGTPSGGIDSVIRIYTAELAKRWNQNVIVENRTGAAGALGHEVAARAQPDGYTLYVNSDAAMGYALLGQTEYDVEKYFTPITILASAQNVCVTSAESSTKTLGALLAYAKANPGKVNWGNYLNTPNHVQLLRLFRSAGMEITLVPYNNSTQMQRAALSGEVHVTCIAATKGLAELARTGRLVALAAMGRERIGDFPDAPTFREAKVDFDWDQVICALLAPAATPTAIVSKLRADIGELMKQPEIIAKVRNVGFEPEMRSPAESSASLWRYPEQLRKVMQDSGFKPATK